MPEISLEQCITGQVYFVYGVKFHCFTCGKSGAIDFHGMATDDWACIVGKKRRRFVFVNGNPCGCQDDIWLSVPGYDLSVYEEALRKVKEVW
jgi:hypothetical protein